MFVRTGERTREQCAPKLSHIALEVDVVLLMSNHTLFWSSDVFKSKRVPSFLSKQPKLHEGES